MLLTRYGFIFFFLGEGASCVLTVGYVLVVFCVFSSSGLMHFMKRALGLQCVIFFFIHLSVIGLLS